VVNKSLVRSLRLAAGVLPLLALAACNSTGLRATKPVSLSITSTPAVLPARSIGASFAVAAAPAADVVVDSVHLVLSHLQLAVATATCSASTGGPQGECDDLALPPALVKTTVGEGVKTVLSAPVPIGSYAALEAKIDVVSTSDDQPGAAAFLAANPTFKDISVKVYGKYKGTAFVYTSAAKAELEIAFATPLQVAEAGTTNVTLALDPASWFQSSPGVYVDPTSPANAALVAANIRKAFKAFQDDNKDGIEDKR
jgi:hypothetical protein